MLRQTLALTLAASLSYSSLALGQPVTADADVLRGIRQVEDGDYDPAIVTLDAAARRLTGDPARARDLSQAYLYLGIAYIGKGHEAAAKAKFREAVAQIKDLTLSPDKFPPKVIDLFEAARAEARAQATPAPAAAATPAPAAAKKGGGGKTILIVGGLAAVGGGVALAAGGGGGASRAAAVRWIWPPLRESVCLPTECLTSFRSRQRRFRRCRGSPMARVSASCRVW